MFPHLLRKLREGGIAYRPDPHAVLFRNLVGEAQGLVVEGLHRNICVLGQARP